MGLTKQYLRYAPSAVFGVIGSQKANIAYVTLRGGEKGRYVAVAACEHVFVWDIRKGEKVRLLTFYHLLKTPQTVASAPDFTVHISSVLAQVLILQGQKHEVTYLCPSPDGIHIAVGYEDGGVRIFSLLNGESNVSFNGHKSAVSVIHYDGLGARLVTGSRVRFGSCLTLLLLLLFSLIEHSNRKVLYAFFFYFLIFCPLSSGHRRDCVGHHQ